MLVVYVTIVHMEGMYALMGHGGYVLRSTEPLEGVRNLPIFWYMADIMLGAYFKVAQRVRKARISPEPCDACLRATLNARGIALEGTELGGSIPRVPISSVKAGCVDAST